MCVMYRKFKIAQLYETQKYSVIKLVKEQKKKSNKTLLNASTYNIAYKGYIKNTPIQWY